jgi:hypothetical protein
MKANVRSLKGRGIDNKHKSLWAKHYEKTLKVAWASPNLGSIVKIVQSSFIHRFIHIIHKYHALKTHLIHG